MSCVKTAINIRKPIEEVFAYVTTPEGWLRWHPSSVSITGDTDHSLKVGEQVKEEFVVAGRLGSVTWTVIDREVPKRWVISGCVEEAGSGEIAYFLAPGDNGISFEREFTYRMDNWVLSLLDWLLIRRRIQAESTEAMQRLKRILEEDV